MKYKSCRDLEKSIYLAPNEIRSCCQRFFYKGKMRGDAKLLDIDKNNSPKPSDIQNRRKILFNDIQKNKVASCLGCPHLYERSEKPNFTSDIEHLSIEHHSFCNLRCSYCSEIYYGGKKSNYNVVAGNFTVMNNKSNDLKKFKPEIRIYKNPETLTFEASIKTNLLSDKYLTMSNIQSSEYYNIKFQEKPLMIWIWISVILMSLGGITRFYRSENRL